MTERTSNSPRLEEDPDQPHHLGAWRLASGRCRFLVWAPLVDRVDVEVLSPSSNQATRIEPLKPAEKGYFHAELEMIPPQAKYFFRLNGETREKNSWPDPASRFQPQGVHGPSQILDEAFAWTDEHWHGLPLRDYILYELHVGTFSQQGTFDGVEARLDDLKALGVTAIELLPIAQFPGDRNWGYDGSHPFAVQNSYGGPAGLQRLVNSAHARQMAVVLDVVYNHLGPEGNYLGQFGPYFTSKYRTPWGEAINFDGPRSDEVRRYFIENALYWLREFHIDALRLDAVHAIYDESARPFLWELATAVREEGERLNRRVYTIAESNKNDPRHVRSAEAGGFGLDAQWNDDYHHSLRVLLTDERRGYYEDFVVFDDLVKSLREGFAFDGRFSKYRGRRHGQSSIDIPTERLVIFSQNHDQVGNRMGGERLGELVCLERLKLAAGLTLLAPYTPLLFMGEEYGETAPFLYFVSHGDPDLIESVRRGRKEEFASFQWEGEIPDPQAEQTFQRSILNPSLREKEPHNILWSYYQWLIALRKSVPALSTPSKQQQEVHADSKQQTITLLRACPNPNWANPGGLNGSAALLFYFGKSPASAVVPLPKGRWRKMIDSADRRWNGPGNTIPKDLTSSGEGAFSLTPWSCLAFVSQPDDL